MFIEIRELELHPVDFREEFAPGAIDLGTEVRQRTALTASGRELVASGPACCAAFHQAEQDKSAPRAGQPGTQPYGVCLFE